MILNPHWWQNKIKYNSLVQRAFLARNLSNRFPAMLNIEVTNACNLDCSFCPRKLTNRKIGFISEEFFKKIIDELFTRGGIEVLYLMKDGEPLLHPGIDKLIAYARRKTAHGFAAKRLEVYTNGILLDRAMGERLIKSGLDVLTVSLDATDAKTFKKLKGRDEYQRVVEQVRNFAMLKKEMGSKKPLLAVKMVRVSENEGEVRKFKQMWTGVADDVIIQRAHEWEGSMGLEQRAQITEHRNRVILRSASDEEPVLSLPKESSHDRKGILRLSTHSTSLGAQNDGGRYPCNLPWLAPAINWDGKVVPCCVNFRENELVMGDVSKNSLAEIYTGPKFEALRKAHLRQDFSEFPTCERCTYWSMLPGMERWLKKLTC